VTECVVRKMLKYVHDFKVATTWSATHCRATVEDVQWTNLQRLAWRWTDRNGAVSVARDLDAYVVRLRAKKQAQ
jgi:hypothetical protein